MCDVVRVACAMMLLQALLLSYRGEARAVTGGSLAGEAAVVMTIGGGVVVDDDAMHIISTMSSRSSSSSVAVLASLSHFSCCSSAFAHRNASLWSDMQAAMARVRSSPLRCKVFPVLNFIWRTGSSYR